MLATPAREYTEFPSALSFLPNPPPAEAIEASAGRVARLEERLAALSQEIAEVDAHLPRLFAIESEYRRQVVEAELGCIRGLVEDLRAERMTWPVPRRREVAAAAAHAPERPHDQQRGSPSVSRNAVG